MEWTRGHTEETSSGTYQKLAISLDEGDFNRLLAERAPGVLPSEVPVRDVYRIMESEAEILLRAAMLSRLGYDKNKTQQVISALTDTQNSIIEKLKGSAGE